MPRRGGGGGNAERDAPPQLHSGRGAARRRACGAAALAAVAAVLLACLAPTGAQKSMAGSARAQERTRGFKSADTDITGLRMEDVVENVRGVLDRSGDSLRMSNLPLREVAKMTQELQDAVAKKGPPEKRWLEAGNVAKYNGLYPEPYITVPVTMNLIFIGFSGDGHYKLNLAEEELKPWFEHMEHRMEHTLVPTNDAPDASHPTRNTHIYYKYDFHVLELHPDVDAIIEAIIWDNARAEDPWGEPAIKWTSQDMHQVDIAPMENALADLVDCLRLNNSYTLFLMNPKLPYPDFNYGYRYGFSKAELDHMHENASLVRDLMGRDKVRPVMQMTPELKEDVHTLYAQVKSFKGEDPEEKVRTLERQRAKVLCVRACVTPAARWLGVLAVSLHCICICVVVCLRAWDCVLTAETPEIKARNRNSNWFKKWECAA